MLTDLAAVDMCAVCVLHEDSRLGQKEELESSPLSAHHATATALCSTCRKERMPFSSHKSVTHQPSHGSMGPSDQRVFFPNLHTSILNPSSSRHTFWGSGHTGFPVSTAFPNLPLNPTLAPRLIFFPFHLGASKIPRPKYFPSSPDMH